jgi:hypothetical protein
LNKPDTRAHPEKKLVVLLVYQGQKPKTSVCDDKKKLSSDRSVFPSNLGHDTNMDGNKDYSSKR